MRTRLVVVVLVVLPVAAACSGAADTTSTLGPPPLPGSPMAPEGEPPPELDPEKVAVGKDLYAGFCASCHGADLAGDPNWKIPNQDGSYRPPPQDSSGHTWHHGDGQLVEIILEGSEFPQSRMSPFRDRLTESEVMSILEFFKSTWGPQERAVQWEMTLRERGQS